MIRKFVALIVVACFVGGTFLVGSAQPPKDTAKMRSFMRQKLEHTKELLEGLALEDYEKIAKNSQALSLLSMESSWNVVTTEDYLQYSKDFRRSANAITKAAHEENLDGAALAYVDLAMRCVDCHKYLRHSKKLP
jgi:hypothetical protein